MSLQTSQILQKSNQDRMNQVLTTKKTVSQESKLEARTRIREKDQFFTTHVRELEGNYEKKIRNLNVELNEIRGSKAQLKEMNHQLTK